MASDSQRQVILDATLAFLWRPIPNTKPFWTPYSRPLGVRFPLSSLFGRHYRFLMASISQHQVILDAILAFLWRPFPNTKTFWTPPPISPGVRLIRICDFGRLSRFPVASISQLPAIQDATITGATSASPWRPFPKWRPSAKYRLNHNAFLIDLYFFKSII